MRARRRWLLFWLIAAILALIGRDGGRKIHWIIEKTVGYDEVWIEQPN